MRGPLTAPIDRSATAGPAILDSAAAALGVDATPFVAAPTMTAVVPQPASSVPTTRLLGWLAGGGVPDTPLAAPFVWAAAAAARRELFSPVAAVPPAAQVTAAQPVTPRGAYATGPSLPDSVEVLLGILFGAAEFGLATPTDVMLLAADPSFVGYVAQSAVPWFTDTFAGVVPGASGTTDQEIAGNAVATLVASVLVNPVVALTISSGLNGTDDTLLTLAGELFVDGNSDAALALLSTRIGEIATDILIDPLAQIAIANGVSDAVEVLLGVGAPRDGAITVQSPTELAWTVNQLIAPAVARLLGDNPLAGPAGAAVGSAIQFILTADGGLAATVGQGLASVAGAAAETFLLQGGVSTALGDAVTSYLGGTSSAAVLQTLMSDPDVIAAVGQAAIAGIGVAGSTLLNNSQIQSLIGGAIGQMATGFLWSPAVQTFAANAFSEWLTGTDSAAVLVQPLVSDVDLNSAVGTVAKDFVTTFLQNGTSTAVTNAATAFVQAVLNGSTTDAAAQQSLQNFMSAPGVGAALTLAVSQALENAGASPDGLFPVLETALNATILSWPSHAEVVGNIAGQLVFSALGSDPAAAVVGTAAAIAVQNLLGNSHAVTLLADELSAAGPDFLKTPAVIAAFSGAAGQFASSLAGGSSIEDALQAARTLLESDAGFTGAADTVVGDLVRSLLSDSGNPSALVEALGPAVAQGLSSSLTINASSIGGLVDQWVNGQIGGANGAVIGHAAGVAVTNLLSDSSAVSALAQAIGAVAPDLLRDHTVVDKLADVTGRIASAVAAGTPFSEALQTALTSLQTDTQFIGAATDAVSNSASTLLADANFRDELGTVTSDFVKNLLADGDLRKLAGDEVARLVSDALGGGFIGAALGDAAGGAVASLLADPFVREALGAATATLVRTFLDQPGIGTTLTLATEQFATAVLSGTPADSALTTVLQGLQTTPEVQAALDGSISAVVTSLQTDFLGSQPVQRALGSAGATAVIRLLSSPIVRNLLGDNAAQIVLADLGTQGAEAFGKATANLLARPSVIRSLSTLFGFGITDFLGQPGVNVALGAALQQIADDVAAGIEPSVALQTALQSLNAVQPQLGVAIDRAITLSGTVLLANPSVQSALGSTTEDLINAFAADPTLRAMLKNELGSTWGPAVAQLLDDPTLRDDLAAVVGESVGRLLRQAGVITQVTTAGRQLADSVLGGGAWGDALLAALSSLRADAVVQAGVNAIVPGSLASLLARPDIRTAVGGAAVTVVNNLLGEYGIDPGSLGPAVNYLVRNVTAKALADPGVTALLGDAAARYIDGASTDDVVTFILQGITRSPELQGALGTAVGQTVGDAVASLSGNGPFGTIVGLVAGGVVTTALNLAAQFTLLSTNGVGPVYGDATPPSAGSSTYLYVMSLQGSAIRSA